MKYLPRSAAFHIFSIVLLTVRISLLFSTPQLPETPPKLSETPPQPPTIFIAGNSTASNGAENGWGSHLQVFFDPERVAVDNRARGGRSSRTFITEGWWDSLNNDLRPGDYVLIEFGHNDAGKINDDSRARGSIPGIGEDTLQIINQVTGKPETVHTFGWYLRKMIGDVQEKGATPVVLSMTARNVWPGGEIERDNKFCNLSAEVAAHAGIDFIDLRNMTADQYAMLGPVRVRELFPVDHTHTGAEGAYMNAALVVAGLRAIHHPLEEKLSASGRSVTPYGPSVMVKQVEEWMTSTWMPGVQPERDPGLPTLYTIGNSTVRNGTKGDGSNGEWGWGAPVADFFDRSRLNVENRALGGTSSRTFRTLGLWQSVLDDLQPGDVVIMQFGHNDSSPVNDEKRARGTIAGNGEESVEIENLLTGKAEVVHTYGWYIRQYIRETREKGATPIVCSPIPRNHWTDGKVNRSVDSYGQWAAAAAQQEGAAFIDLNQLICDHYDAAGQERVTALYFPPGETTHTNAMGAQLNAACVVEGARELQGVVLAGYLAGYPAFYEIP
ncbi:MAG: rhamnogalacturonan acetylesterase [Bacteroidales bacterium]|nr:rhamnogalacturonan acetylesterase [Bacteroidales bacterium]